MKKFLLLKHPDNRLEAVKQGFSFPGVLLGGGWLLWHKVWLAGVLTTVVGVGAYVIFPSPEGYILGIPYGHRFGFADIINIGIQLTVGILGNEWRVSSLRDRGFDEVGEALAATPDGAKADYLVRARGSNANEPEFSRREHSSTRREPS